MAWLSQTRARGSLISVLPAAVVQRVLLLQTAQKRASGPLLLLFWSVPVCESYVRENLVLLNMVGIAAW